MLNRSLSIRVHRAGIKRWVLAFASVTVSSTASAQLWSPHARERQRLLELIGATIPAPSPAPSPVPELSASLLTPTLYGIWNSNIPYSLNDGALWAGRGANVSVTFGGTAVYRARRFSVSATLAPTFVASQNRPFGIVRGSDSSRSAFSSPWHDGAASADLPLRFGDRPTHELGFGESAIDVTVGPVSAGVSAMSEWWGPGLRNALVLGTNAGGIPRAFIKTAKPVRTAIGELQGELFLGTLTESRFFDTVATNDYRSVDGLLLTYRPAFDTSLTLGFARTVYAPARRAIPPIARSLDAVTRWEALAPPSDSLASGYAQHADQLFSLFARWLIPVARSEVYGEWARQEAPRSLRELLVAPQSTQGFTVGLQSAVPLSRTGSYVRAQVEFTDVEQSIVFADRPPPDFYTGRVSPQGYTQRGQIVGAAIGPGGSAQFAAVDYIAPRWEVGALIGRTRWENDAMMRQRFASAARHDVTIYSGVRGAWRGPHFTTAGQLTIGRRFNYLFQNDAFNAGETPRSAVDVQNVTLEFQLSP